MAVRNRWALCKAIRRERASEICKDVAFPAVGYLLASSDWGVWDSSIDIMVWSTLQQWNGT